MLNALATSAAPEAIGPYSQAVRAGEWLFVSGQIPLDPDTGQLVTGGAAEQTSRVIRNLAAILDAAGGSLADVAKTTVYVTNLDDFGAVNAAYEEGFGQHRPARATVQVARLPKDVALEIEAVAYLPRKGH